MIEQRPIWGFTGGSAEFVKAGEMEIVDEETNQKKMIEWENHILVIVGRRKAKLRTKMIVGICQLLKESKEFREYVDQCP